MHLCAPLPISHRSPTKPTSPSAPTPAQGHKHEIKPISRKGIVKLVYYSSSVAASLHARTVRPGKCLLQVQTERDIQMTCNGALLPKAGPWQS